MWMQTENGFKYITDQTCEKILSHASEPTGNFLVDLPRAFGEAIPRGIDEVTNWIGNEGINKFTDYFIKGSEFMSCKYGGYQLSEYLSNVLDSLEPTLYFIGNLILGIIGGI